MLDLGLINRLPKLSVIQAEGAAPLARLFAALERRASRRRTTNLPATMAPVENPRTLATAIKIGAPVSWKKSSARGAAFAAVQMITVSEQEIADAKAMIGRDGIGCEPASATTVAGIRKLVAAGQIDPDEDVIAVLTGHMLKDPDYVSQLSSWNACDRCEGPPTPQPIRGAFPNVPERVAANKSRAEDFRTRIRSGESLAR